MALLTSWTGRLMKQNSAKNVRYVQKLRCSARLQIGSFESSNCFFPNLLLGCFSINSCSFSTGFGMFLLMVFCISEAEPVTTNTANKVETVTAGRTMPKVVRDVLSGRMDCMPNMLWLKRQEIAC